MQPRQPIDANVHITVRVNLYKGHITPSWDFGFTLLNTLLGEILERL